MPADIRSFFGGKRDQSALSSQEIPHASRVTTEPKPKVRGKRKVVSDSEDEPQDQALKQSTPKKIQAQKAMKKESPKGQATTTSDYFASHGKTRPARSTTVKPKATSNGGAVDSEPLLDSVESTPKAASIGPAITELAVGRSGQVSSRKKARTIYAKRAEEDVEGEYKALKDDDDSGEDIYRADFKRSGKKMEDDYESDDDKAEWLKPVRQRRKAITKEKDVDVQKEQNGATNRATADKKAKDTESVKGRKRKSAESAGNEEEGEKTAHKSKKMNSAKVSPVERAKIPSKKEVVAENEEMQEILDSIPLVRPPTPPNRDISKKFDFVANAQRLQPPSAAGNKKIPIGADNCLAGHTFVFTGILDSLGREEGIELVKRYGGKVTGAPSSKTSYVVLGNDAGPKKLETIAKFNLKTINEDGLYALIERLPANGGDSKAAEKFEGKRQAEEQKIKEAAEQMDKQDKQERRKLNATITSSEKVDSQPASQKQDAQVDSRLWTVKYAPSATNQICGNKSQVDKLQRWLRNWRDNARTKFKKAGVDGSGVYRAVMIHGGPGIGKTTAAHLVAKLEGYDIVESNASDTRSKKLVETGLKGVLDTTSLFGYFAGDNKTVDTEKKKLVLIMDEVDGMSAGDRGGVGALAAVCKKTNIPMILICNDRRLPKMKPFDHATYDIPFRKPTTDQIRSRIMTILYREGMKDMIPSTVVNSIIEGSRSDIRQIINMISTAKLDQQALDFDSGKKMANAWEKHVILKPWDIVNKILGGGMFASSSTSNLNEKIELYFNDHEFSSLMLQENYLGTNPILSNTYQGREKNLKILELADQAAESISDGDLVDRMIHGSQQQWSLMPTHAVFSFVRPASFMSGSLAGHGQTRFTSWLGNNSKLGKLSRLVKEIQGHMRLRASGDRHEIRQQYLPVLWTRIVKGLELQGEEKTGIEEIISLMDSYFLTKDDWDAIYELGLGPQAMERVNLKSQVKGSFTRTYNQQSHPLPFMKAGGGLPAVKRAKEVPDLEEAIEESDDDEVLADAVVEEEDEELDLKKDKYIRAPRKKTAPKKAAAKKGTPKAKKAVDEEDEEMKDVGSEEETKATKGKGKATAARTKGRGPT